MSETTKAVFNIFINGSVDAVWREITKQDEPQGCFFDNWMETDRMEEGGRMRMLSRSRKNVGVIGEIILWQPKTKFGHTFRFTHYDDPPCKVFYELTPKDGGVDFTMTLEDLPADTKTAKDMIRGGDMITKSLKAIVENGKPSLGTRALYGMFRLMEPMTPKECREENWPLEKISTGAQQIPPQAN